METEYSAKMDQIKVDPEYAKRMEQQNKKPAVNFDKLSIDEKINYINGLSTKAEKEPYRQKVRSQLIKLSAKETDPQKKQKYLNDLMKVSSKDEMRQRNKAIADAYKERQKQQEEAKFKHDYNKNKKQIDKDMARVQDEKNASNYKFQQDNAEMIKKADKKNKSMVKNAETIQHMANNPISDKKNTAAYTGMNLFDHAKKQLQYLKDKRAQKKNLDTRVDALNKDKNEMEPVKNKLDEQIQKNKNFETKKRILMRRRLNGKAVPERSE